MNDMRRQNPERPKRPERTVFEPPPETPGAPPETPEPLPETPDLPREIPGSPEDAIHRTLRTIKWVVLAILALAVVAGLYFFGSRLFERGPADSTKPTPAPTQQGGDYPDPSAAGAAAGQSGSVSCLSATGPDATTTSRTFVNVDGTECTYRTGPTPETLVLNGKLIGRNTEGTGMAVTINVNDKDCHGGETLSYARAYTPFYANCTFVVPANSAVGIKWRFLSPFGGTAAVLRSSKNIAPSITGVAVPNESNGTEESDASGASDRP